MRRTHFGFMASAISERGLVARRWLKSYAPVYETKGLVHK